MKDCTQPGAEDVQRGNLGEVSRIRSILREDLARLGRQESYEEMVFSLSVVVGTFAFLGFMIEMVIKVHG